MARSMMMIEPMVLLGRCVNRSINQSINQSQSRRRQWAPGSVGNGAWLCYLIRSDFAVIPAWVVGIRGRRQAWVDCWCIRGQSKGGGGERGGGHRGC